MKEPLSQEEQEAGKQLLRSLSCDIISMLWSLIQKDLSDGKDLRSILKSLHSLEVHTPTWFTVQDGKSLKTRLQLKVSLSGYTVEGTRTSM